MVPESKSSLDVPTREAIDASRGTILLEFGAAWCGYCRALRPQVAAILENHPDVEHLKVEDGPGQPLGRSFRVKLWPTFILLKDGVVLDRAARPAAFEIRRMLERRGPLSADQTGGSL